MLRGIKLSVHKPPTPKPLFSLQQLREISRLCQYFPSPAAFRAAYLVAFFGFFRISNIAPPFRSSFDPTRHLLRNEVLFAHPGCHLPVKWAKNIQAPKRALWCKLPSLSDPLLCPVTAIQELLRSVPALPSAPLFASLNGTTLSQSDLRKRLASILQVMRLPPFLLVFILLDAPLRPLPLMPKSRYKLFRPMAIGGVMPSGHTFQQIPPNPFRSPWLSKTLLLLPYHKC